MKKKRNLEIRANEELLETDYIQEAGIEITETLLNKFPEHASSEEMHITIMLNVLNQAFLNILLLLEDKEREKAAGLFNKALLRQLKSYQEQDADSKS